MKTTVKLGAAALGLAALSLPALAQEDGGRKLTAMLSGEAAFPGPGDENGAGLFDARVNPGTERICYTLDVSNIEDATAAHIHMGPEGEAGPPVLTLDTPGEDDDSEECQDIDRALATEIIREPEAYYVNVHNDGFPQGAIRGQLSK